MLSIDSKMGKVDTHSARNAEISCWDRIRFSGGGRESAANDEEDAAAERPVGGDRGLLCARDGVAERRSGRAVEEVPPAEVLGPWGPDGARGAAA